MRTSEVVADGRRGGRRIRLRTQVLLLQCAVVALTLSCAFCAFAYVNNQHVLREYQVRALEVARTIASDPVVRDGSARWSAARQEGGGAGPGDSARLAAGPVQAVAQAARSRTHSLFVVVTDDRGVRLAHPEVSQLGRRVSTDPRRALAGHEVLARDHAHLGEEVVAKVPVYAPHSSHVVGEANAGVAASHVHDRLVRVLLGGLVCLALALLLGVAASAVLARRWKRLTLGLEPEELVRLVQEQEAVLHGVGEGVLAFDPGGTVTVVNDEARRLLALDAAVGAHVDALGLVPRVREAARGAAAGHTQGPVVTAVAERVLVVAAHPVRRAGRDLGALVTVKDRTDVESLTRQLDAVQAMGAALRAQRHEFSNRLHVLAGLVHGGHPRRAAAYLDTLMGPGAGLPGAQLPGAEAVGDEYLRTFLGAKAAEARESGVRMVLGEGTWVDTEVVEPVDVTTVLGNLVDNAVHAAGAGRRSAAAMEVEMMTEGTTLLVTVADSGEGVAADHVDAVFEDGFSTKDHSAVVGGRGVGLALVRQIARARGGDVVLAEAGGPSDHAPAPNEAALGGAVFVARLPRTVREAR